MPKGLCIAGVVVAILLLLISGLDAAIEVPFGRVSLMMDIGLILCSAVLGYLSWTTLQEQV